MKFARATERAVSLVLVALRQARREGDCVGTLSSASGTEGLFSDSSSSSVLEVSSASQNS